MSAADLHTRAWARFWRGMPQSVKESEWAADAYRAELACTLDLRAMLEGHLDAFAEWTRTRDDAPWDAFVIALGSALLRVQCAREHRRHIMTLCDTDGAPPLGCDCDGCLSELVARIPPDSPRSLGGPPIHELKGHCMRSGHLAHNALVRGALLQDLINEH